MAPPDLGRSVNLNQGGKIMPNFGCVLLGLNAVGRVDNQKSSTAEKSSSNPHVGMIDGQRAKIKQTTLVLFS